VADALILGGGLAGSAAACLIARGGGDVHLLERETGAHHKVCGEFLSVEAVAHLRQLGVEPLDLGAVPIHRMRLVWENREVEAALPFAALGLSRHVLDEALISQAAANGARVERGVRVTELDGHVARTNVGEREGRQVLIATGKLPIRGEKAPARIANGHVGFKMHYRLAPSAARQLAETIVLALLDGGYAGLQLVENGRANLCLVLRAQAFARLGGDWQGVRACLDGTSQLQRILADAEPLFARPLAIANLGYGPPPRGHATDIAGAMFLGDRWAMTPSLTGDGMAIALRSGLLAAGCVLAGESAGTYHRLLAAETRRQIARATILQNGFEAPAFRHAAYWLARLYPALLTHAARATRLPDWSGP
jgi:flavin-dependent dehydrogenase